ncbi:uncharacterized protein LOC105648867 [Jatropha curcas]|uniref:uncharacterized protein LOC105648867 n=1 Tax=Jatropha curcas TaxID=180498 RepID=UPI0009D77A66|nr:uncharacterized protein LOC105648867 [Jatropha curcas]
MRLEIQDDAACVDLKSHSSCFYEFGCKLAPLHSDHMAMHIIVYEAPQSSLAAFKKRQMDGPWFQSASILGRKKEPSEWVKFLSQ